MKSQLSNGKQLGSIETVWSLLLTAGFSRSRLHNVQVKPQQPGLPSLRLQILNYPALILHREGCFLHEFIGWKQEVFSAKIYVKICHFIPIILVSCSKFAN